MTCHALLIFVLAGLAGVLPAAGQKAPVPAVEPASAMRAESLGPPARPDSRVLDQTGTLTAPELAALSHEFTTATGEGLSFYFIALKSSEGLPEQDAAGELARLWEDAPLTAVLLHLPGQPMALGFAGPRLASLPSGEIKSLTTSALAASRAHPLMPEQVKAVARSLRGDINHTQAGESHMAMTDPGAAALFDGSNHHLMLAGGCAAVVFLLALLLLAHRRRAHRPRLFPLTAPRERFSAPHSGGNNAMVTFLEDIKRR